MDTTTNGGIIVGVVFASITVVLVCVLLTISVSVLCCCPEHSHVITKFWRDSND